MNHAQSIPVQKTPLKLSTSVTLMVSTVLVSVLLVVHFLYFFQISDVTRKTLQDKAETVARTLADSPTVISTLEQSKQSALLQQFAENVRQRNNLLFVVITDINGIRYSHPNPAMIGKHFIGEDLIPALRGQENTAINHGVLVEAMRVFTPVYNATNQQIGVVAIGISLENVTTLVNASRWSILWTVLFGTLVGTLGTWCLVHVLKRIMLGFEPHEISTLFEQRDAMLQSIKEGVIAVDNRSHITLINQEAKRLFKQSGSLETLVTGNSLKHWPMLMHLNEVLCTGIARRDEEISFKGRLFLSNIVPVVSHENIIGAICTFRDKTEVSQLMQRLSGMANYADALRAQSHEFMNKLHVILGLLHMKSYPQLERFILKTANNYQTEIGTLLAKIKSPVIAGFLLGKINRARDAGIILSVSDDSLLPDTDNEDTNTLLITVLGNLIENALDAMKDQDGGEISVTFHHRDGLLHCVVSDDGPGILPDHLTLIFQLDFSTKGSDRGLGLSLVKQCLDAMGGTVSAESEPGVYTQFFIQLPYSDAADAP